MGDRKAGVMGTFHRQGKEGAAPHGASLPAPHLLLSPRIHPRVPFMPCSRSDQQPSPEQGVAFREATRS